VEGKPLQISVGGPFESEKESARKQEPTEDDLPENVNDLSAENERLLRAAYKHPFEYINSELYKKKTVYSIANLKLHVENEEECEAMHDEMAEQDSSSMARVNTSGSLTNNLRARVTFQDVDQ